MPHIETLVRPATATHVTRTRMSVQPLVLVRWSVALCYLWFGALKFVPGLSPAEALAERTMNTLTFGIVHGTFAVALLGCLECAIGVALIARLRMRLALQVLIAHMLFTFSPLFLFPDLCFSQAPLALTLTGQYIIKNLVITSVAWMLLCQDPSKGS